MAEGRSNTAIARALVVSDGAVEKHVRNIFAKLDLPPGRRAAPPGAGRAGLPAHLTGPGQRGGGQGGRRR